jgi:pyruvate formate lyase activating enzyme
VIPSDEPLVLDVRRFALDDGPGIRSVVFLKGCPLACAWCHNPEAIRPEAEMVFHADRCLDCGGCTATCPRQAVLSRPTRLVRARCAACGLCADACPTLALVKRGEAVAVETLVQRLLVDRVLYETSGGGVTFSGGEPTLHGPYLACALRRLRQEGVSVTLETCGLFDLRFFLAELLPHLDRIYFDVKFIDEGLHRRYTGSGNRAILRNLAALAEAAPRRLTPRVPLVQGITAREENLSAIAGHLRRLGLDRAVPLPYHPGGLAKRRTLGLPIPLEVPDTMLPAADQARWARLL